MMPTRMQGDNAEMREHRLDSDEMVHTGISARSRHATEAAPGRSRT